MPTSRPVPFALEVPVFSSMYFPVTPIASCCVIARLVAR